MREEIRNTWIQSEEDLRTAELIIEVGRFYASVFFSQQEDYLEHSDVDLIVVSDDFDGVFFPDRSTAMYKFWDGGLPLEVLCYTVEEFEKKKRMIGLVQDAVSEGISLRRWIE